MFCLDAVKLFTANKRAKNHLEREKDSDNCRDQSNSSLRTLSNDNCKDQSNSNLHYQMKIVEINRIQIYIIK